MHANGSLISTIVQDATYDANYLPLTEVNDRHGHQKDASLIDFIIKNTQMKES